ncbi:sulfotransferase family 2 domain-containing protein [Roseovarius sp. S4756]|uniref:sulfotransferase family 2 domain-containing protein n=1 Tax=Roseovarius maritimus TaxID=3342637 RepID=UPI00372821A5
MIKHLASHPRVETKRVKPEWLYTTRRYPLYWHHIPKNGGTFFKSLLYYLDNERLIDPETGRHDWDDQLERASQTSLEEIERNAHNLIIMRNPIHRFLSVYFDKVYHGGGPRRPGMSREFFAAHDLREDKNLSAAGHTENCLKLAQWAASNIAGETRTKPNWHLVPQTHQLTQVFKSNFHVLTLEGFRWQLVHFLKDLVPDIEKASHAVGARNKSPKPIRKSDILTPELTQRLKEIYADDFRSFRQVRRYWRELRQRELS